jgi:hypothetical protein
MGLTYVTFLPPVPMTEMAAAPAGADACLAILKPIDEYKTTYPNKVFDSMAAGRQVVLAIDVVIRTVVKATGCGVFAQPGNPSALAKKLMEILEKMVKTKKAVEKKVSRGVICEITLPKGATLQSGKIREEFAQLEGRAYKIAFVEPYDEGTSDRLKVEWVVHAPKGGTVKLVARHERAGVVRAEVQLRP